MKKIECGEGELLVELNKEFDIRSTPVWDEYEDKGVLWHTQIFKKDGSPASTIIRDKVPLSIDKPYRDNPLVKILTMIGYADNEAKNILGRIKSEFLKIPKEKIEERVKNLIAKNNSPLDLCVGKYYSITIVNGGGENMETKTIQGVINDIGSEPYRFINVVDGNGNNHLLSFRYILEMSEERNV
ncbi:MAG: hypothetical protein L6265_10810 [Thermoplasmatales archaeon]|nr:hypothetical protein [Thermoplasmatales archaeon]